MSTTWFKVFGSLTLAFQAVMLLMLASPRARHLGPLTPEAVIRLAVFFFSASAVSVGLIFLRRWAALFFSSATMAASVGLILGSITQVPFPWNLANISLGVILMLPAVLTARNWGQLSWGGRWFI